MSFRDSVVRGVNLIREAIQSPDFQTGVTGWQIAKDGTAEFNSAIIRGDITADSLFAGDANGSHIIVDPDVEVGFNDGFLEAVVRMFPQDPNYMMEGMLGVVTFDQGNADQEMSSILHSPVLDGGHGYGLVLAAEADDASRSAHAAMGPITAEGMAMAFSGIHMFEDYGFTTPAHLSYPGTPGQVVETFQTAGAFSWTAPVGVTSVQVECWGGGGAGGAKFSTLGGGGGGGGEYVRRLTASVVPGNTYNGVVGAGGATAGANGGDSTITTAASTTTAHGGTGASNQIGGAGGTGATVGTHHDGGSGGSTAYGSGGGGGGAAGTTTAGSLGAPGDSHGFGGTGGAGGTLGGGTGGKGGNAAVVGTGSTTGARGGAPGAGGGGAGNAPTGQFGLGAVGQVRLTYTPSIIPIAASMAAEAGIDRFGNAYAAGFAFLGNRLSDSSNFFVSQGVASSTQAISTTRTDVTGMTTTFTTQHPNALILTLAQWDVTTSAGVAGTGSISVGEVIVDGTLATQIGVGSEAVTQRESFACVPIPSVLAAAGSHTVKGTIRKSGTATAAISAGVGTTITVLVLDIGD